MSIVSVTTVKSYFQTGDKPTQAEFEDLIDTAIRLPLVAVASGAEGGKTGVVVHTGPDAVTFNTAGTTGLDLLSAEATASAQGHLGVGSFGSSFIATDTTAQARDLLAIAASGTAANTLNDLTDVSAAMADDGSLLYYRNGQWVELAIGASAQRLVVSGSALAWASAAGTIGGWATVASVTLGASANSGTKLRNIFTDGDKTYRVEFDGLQAVNNGVDIHIHAVIASAAVSGAVYNSTTFPSTKQSAWRLSTISNGTDEGVRGFLEIVNPGSPPSTFKFVTGGFSYRRGSTGLETVFSFTGTVEASGAFNGLDIGLTSSTFDGNTTIRVLSR